MRRICGIAVVAALAGTPAAVEAQGLTHGMQRGAEEGDAAAGPVGGVVGGALGGVGGLLGLDQQQRFNNYAVREGRSSFSYAGQLRPGAVLPRTGVAYYQVPPGYGVNPRYRYTIVNGHTVLVDPRTRRVLQVID